MIERSRRGRDGVRVKKGSGSEIKNLEKKKTKVGVKCLIMVWTVVIRGRRCQGGEKQSWREARECTNPSFPVLERTFCFLSF